MFNLNKRRFLLLPLLVIFLFSSLNFPIKVFGATLLLDDFDDGDSEGWEEKTGANGSWSITPDKHYRATVTKTDYSSPDTPTISFAGDTTWMDYTFDFLIRGTVGVDKQVYFRYTNGSTDYYVLNLISPDTVVLVRRHDGGQNQILSIEHQPISNDVWYAVRVELEGSHVRIFLNGELEIEANDPNPQLSGKIALMAWPGYYAGAGSITTTEFDNIKVEGVRLSSPSPIPAPDTQIPLIKQSTLPWGQQEYNTASRWASPEPSTIERWGCALTSAAMVLKYHGTTTMPNGSPLDPGSLNDWLKSERGGYVGNGYVNWWAIRRLTELTNAKYGTGILDFRKTNGFDSNSLDTHISLGQPDILGVENNAHFVVATGKDAEGYTINDPFFDRTHLASYDNSAASTEHFYPTHTNLSALYFTTNPVVELYLTGINGPLGGNPPSGTNVSVINGGNYDVLEPMTEDGGVVTNGQGIRELAVPVPPEGDYTLTAWSESPSPFSLEVVGYNRFGTPSAAAVFGIASKESPEVVNFSYSQQNNDLIESVKRTVTFDSFLADVREAESLGWLKGNHVEKLLLEDISVLRRLVERHQRNASIVFSNVIRTQFGIFQKMGLLDSQAKALLNEDLELLGF